VNIEENRKQKSKGGRPFKHGAFSLSIRDELLRDNPRIRRYLMDTRAGLARDIAGSEVLLSEMQRVMIDRVISKLAVCRLIEAYIEKYGAFRQDRFKRKILELEPCLGNSYLAYSNSIDRALVALGLSKREAARIMTPAELILEVGKGSADAGSKSKTPSPKTRRQARRKVQGKNPQGSGKGNGGGEGPEAAEILDPARSEGEIPTPGESREAEALPGQGKDRQ